MASIITPIRVAFIDIDNVTWNVIDLIFDLIFLADIVISFMSAYYNRMEVLIHSRQTIALHYLKTWFIVDFVAVLPLDYITHSTLHHLGQLLRLPRVFKLIKANK